MKKNRLIFLILPIFLFLSCKKKQENQNARAMPEAVEIPTDYASGLEIVDYGKFQILTVEQPWPEAENGFRYLLVEQDAVVPEGLQYDQKISVPVKKVIVTSTTHIPSLEALGEVEALVGFPGLDYISSTKTRSRISRGLVREVGKNEALNTETILELQPDVVVGFSVNGNNKSMNTIEHSGIPVIFNGDWTETSPLGKAEWIKFFGALFRKNREAAELFDAVKDNYLQARTLAKKASSVPSVVAGAMYRDQWYLPAGNSWQASFIKDANAEYLFKDTPGTGSLSLSLEAVLAKAADADIWVGPAQFTSYKELASASPHYTRFAAFDKRRIFTFSSEKGATGGVLFYELAPNRPDLVLKDLISIFHPELLPDYKTTFYKPLR